MLRIKGFPSAKPRLAQVRGIRQGLRLLEELTAHFGVVILQMLHAKGVVASNASKKKLSVGARPIAKRSKSVDNMVSGICCTLACA